MATASHRVYERFSPVVITDKQAPPRCTTPQSEWRRLMEDMRPGDWFEVPTKFHGRVTNAAVQYLKGRYTCYKHSQKEETYVLSRTK